MYNIKRKQIGRNNKNKIEKSETIIKIKQDQRIRFLYMEM